MRYAENGSEIPREADKYNLSIRKYITAWFGTGVVHRRKRGHSKKYCIRRLFGEWKVTGLSGILKLNDYDDDVIKNRERKIKK